ncbi:hypothetical protein O1L44_31720 [Streptomyces noursei]|nr:hypothetical protein [Streptomyces noursei]
MERPTPARSSPTPSGLTPARPDRWVNLTFAAGLIAVLTGPAGSLPVTLTSGRTAQDAPAARRPAGPTPCRPWRN